MGEKDTCCDLTSELAPLAILAKFSQFVPVTALAKLRRGLAWKNFLAEL